jgi:hypothetical protein
MSQVSEDAVGPCLALMLIWAESPDKTWPVVETKRNHSEGCGVGGIRDENVDACEFSCGARTDFRVLHKQEGDDGEDLQRPAADDSSRL